MFSNMLYVKKKLEMPEINRKLSKSENNSC